MTTMGDPHCGNSTLSTEGVRAKPRPKLWYLIVVLKKTGISLEQVGDEMGLTFLGNVIHQFKLLKPRVV